MRQMTEGMGQMRSHTDDNEHFLNKTDRLLSLSAFLALALIAGYVEYLIPIPVGIPGIKLGLSNVVILICLVICGGREAFIVLILKIFLSGLLFGNYFSTMFSLFGGLLSFAGMYAAFMINGKEERLKLSLIGISMTGGVLHNVGQIICAAFIIKELKVISYLPVLMPAGLLAGGLTGMLSVYVIKPLGKILKT